MVSARPVPIFFGVLLVIVWVYLWMLPTREEVGAGAVARPAPALQSSSSEAATYFAQTQRLAARVDEMQQQYESIRQQQTQLAKTMESISRQLSDSALGSAQSQGAQLQNSSVLEKSGGDTADGTDHNALMAKAELNFKQHMAQLGTQLNQQDFDPGWSDMANEQIQQAVASDGFSGSRLVMSDCRSSLCRMDVLHESKQSLEKFVNGFSRQLAWSDSSGQYKIEEQDGQYLTRFYVSRSGHALPQLSSTH